jgi:predicted glycosyltransferase
LNILIDIGHPAHVHLFRNFAHEIMQKGGRVFFTLRQKEFSEALLQKYGFEYSRYGFSYSGVAGKLKGFVRFTPALYKIVKAYRPDLTISHGSFYLAQVSRLLKVNNITLEDSGNLEQVLLYKPFANIILTPDCYSKDHGTKHLTYKGYHELAYLHPNRFHPDKTVFESLSLTHGDEYAVLRFGSWQASHDMGRKSLSFSEKSKIIRFLAERMKVFISSEGELPAEFEQYRLKIVPDKIHDVLSFATIYLGEGATMASEAGVLGTPSLYVNPIARSYNEDQEKYGTVYNFKNSNGVLEKLKELLSIPDLKEVFRRRREKLLADKIDVTAFLVWFVEHYPESVEIMKADPGFQERFKAG